MTDRLLTISEAARVLRLSPRQVYRLLSAGDLPSVRIRSSVRLTESALRRLIEAGGTSPAKPSTPSTPGSRG